MPSTYSPLKLELMATGEKLNTWGDIANSNWTALEEAASASADVTFSSANVTLSLADTNASQTARHIRLRCTGTTGGAPRDLVVPAVEKPYIVRNDCADAITVKTPSGTGVTVPPGRTMWVYTDGTNVVDVTTHLSGLTLGTALALASGGTGATTASAARSNLGAAASGAVGSSGITMSTARILGRTTTGTGAIEEITIGSGLSLSGGVLSSTAGGGTVTSVNVSGGMTGLTFSGGPITGSGTLTLGGTLAVASGGTGATTFTSGRLLRGNGTSAVDASGISDASIAVAITIDSSGRVGVGTGSPSERLSVSGNITATGALTLGTALSVANGGTGATTASAARSNLGAAASGAVGSSGITMSTARMLGRTTTGTGVVEEISVGSGLSLSAGVLSSTAVTSVDVSGGSTGLTFSGGPITSSGTITLGGTLAVSNGGTGATTASAARSNLGAAASGANTDITSLAQSTTVADTGTASADTLGYRGLPLNAQTFAYTLALADQGKLVRAQGNITIPANSSVAFPVGASVVIYNHTGGNLTISITTDTLRLAGTSSTGTRTLLQRGFATLTKVDTTEWVASGAVL